MLRADIKEKMMGFESKEPVENYQYNGWSVWPVVRTLISYELSMLRALSKPGLSPPPPAPLSKFSLGYWSSRYKKRRSWRQSIALDRQHHEEPDGDKRPVVLLVPSGRRVAVGGSFYDIFSDPIRESLQGLGVKASVWEHGPEIYPRYSPSSWISRQLNYELCCVPTRSSLAVPDWFPDVLEFAKQLGHPGLHWECCEARLIRILNLCSIFEKWFSRCHAQLLISVCWYDPVVMAATMAAKKLGVLSVDLQHGIQDQYNFSYSGWLKAPKGGYQVVPDVFWAWGPETVGSWWDSSPGIACSSVSLIGGNLWFNKCRDSGPPGENIWRQGAQWERTILVALQNGFGIEQQVDRVISAIQGSSHRWRWVLKFHPGMAKEERCQLIEQFQGLDHPGVHCEGSVSISLYELLTHADSVVIGGSSTALEALGFGAPVVVTHENGRLAYGRYIEEGVMAFADTGEKIREVLSNTPLISKKVCMEAVSGTFASGDLAAIGLKQLLASAGISSAPSGG